MDQGRIERGIGYHSLYQAVVASLDGAHQEGALKQDILDVLNTLIDIRNGYGTLDVKVTLETDDGAVIHATYSGRLLFDTMTVYAAPLFQTGDERYAWLNRIQAVSKGSFQPDGTLIYEMFELR